MVQIVHLMVQFSRDTIPLMVPFGHLIVQFSRDNYPINGKGTICPFNGTIFS